MQFNHVERPLVDDEDNRGLNCHGCLFHRQPAAVCRVAAAEAVLRGLRDCDSIDQFGEVVVYVETAVDPRQMDLIGES
ncbi:hypothetical protein IP91_00085 [Pseudoduganella lurida]|uniref:Uncharacterized protein n=1 Tax=Pseudoduganella lurida TaxID=1036180 RepID=A0A562RKR8_9BURK|nr:hypothetical protein [Pseudoduganella lurida]TWI69020.1 hypothetical protein IP91_00085 [Pseudoduganella lurida]